ncbi:PREDICTED: uncharacterized protein LOC104806194 [Tarenaya hassleriana]|uniref:uncharacterized protein LOC104806194 n=1 Tax=Tarenaya hassleriana TaxID=28532 RepID=UPI00053C9C04|nr:PREDICTED: uncharacterized protein LOC104806194 [Tarenaya hassleriana]XP_010529265.1 PREDICTED: uncharacterized protein LOC104806194 [Tarenaya hassleriana]XP_010529266.1 PREDICTED: uncharacterized protein LOC104806194 [Tarenaya hassleriana]
MFRWRRCFSIYSDKESCRRRRKMDSEETGETRDFSSLVRRFCKVIVFSFTSFFFMSLILGFLVMFLGELWVSSSASLPSRCKIVSSTVDLRTSEVCGIGLLNIKAKHMFYPFERDKFRCRYDYYWASVFKVEYKDLLFGKTRLGYAEAPDEALPLKCRPNFSAAWRTRHNFKVNETYDCRYTLGMRKIKLYSDSFFACRAAKDPSVTGMVKQYAVLFARFSRSWFPSEDEVVARIVSGFSTSIIAILLVRILQNAKSWLP